MGEIVPAAEFDLSPWPDDKPFPLSQEECLALCRGDLVKWSGSIEEALELPFRFELIDGCLMLKRTG